MSVEGLNVSLHTTGGEKKGIQSGRTGIFKGEEHTPPNFTNEPSRSTAEVFQKGKTKLGKTWQLPKTGGKAVWTPAKRCNMARAKLPNDFTLVSHTPHHGALVGVALPSITRFR
jgi:hypothetical protein